MKWMIAVAKEFRHPSGKNFHHVHHRFHQTAIMPLVFFDDLKLEIFGRSERGFPVAARYV